jgi:hypothetical protein
MGLEEATLRVLAERDPELPYALIELLPETPEAEDAGIDPEDRELADELDADDDV